MPRTCANAGNGVLAGARYGLVSTGRLNATNVTSRLPCPALWQEPSSTTAMRPRSHRPGTRRPGCAEVTGGAVRRPGRGVLRESPDDAGRRARQHRIVDAVAPGLRSHGADIPDASVVRRDRSRAPSSWFSDVLALDLYDEDVVKIEAELRNSVTIITASSFGVSVHFFISTTSGKCATKCASAPRLIDNLYASAPSGMMMGASGYSAMSRWENELRR